MDINVFLNLVLNKLKFLKNIKDLMLLSRSINITN